MKILKTKVVKLNESLSHDEVIKINQHLNDNLSIEELQTIYDDLQSKRADYDKEYREEYNKISDQIDEIDKKVEAEGRKITKEEWELKAKLSKDRGILYSEYSYFYDTYEKAFNKLVAAKAKRTKDLKKMNGSKEKKISKKQMALETLRKVKEIYDADESDLLVANFWNDFMAEVDEQIKEIEETVSDNY